MIIFMMLTPSVLFGQIVTIDNPLLIGVNNKLIIAGFGSKDSLCIETPFGIISERVGKENYILKITTPRGNTPIVLKNRNEVIDTIIVSVERITLKQYITTSSQGLITSGEYPLEVIKSMKSIELRTNISGDEVIPVLGYTIEISNGEETILMTYIKGKSFEHPEVINVLKRLKKNGLVSIRNIFSATPWSDGNQPQDIYLKAK